MSGPREIEVKLAVPGVDSGRAALSSLGARLVVERHLEDNLLFDTQDGRLRGEDRALRLRTTPAGAILTYKGPREIVEGAKSREEIECRVDAPQALRLSLERVGLAVFFRYQKYREEWQWGSVQLALDETPVGTFIEIEGALEKIHAAAMALGRGPQDYVHESYPALFRARHPAGDMVFQA